MEHNFLQSIQPIVFPFLSPCPSDFTVRKFFLPFHIQLFDFFLITSSYSALTQTFFSSSFNPSVPCIFPPLCINAPHCTHSTFFSNFFLPPPLACYLPYLNSFLDSFSVIIVKNNSRKEAFHRKEVSANEPDNIKRDYGDRGEVNRTEEGNGT